MRLSDYPGATSQAERVGWPLERLVPAVALPLVVSALLLFAAGCSGERPTLTDDLLEDLVATEAEPDQTDRARSDASGSAAQAAPAGDDPLPSDSDPAPTDSEPASEAEVEAPAVPDPNVEQLVVVVEETFPHDPDAFTQGLELHEGSMFESVGLYEKSDVRRVDIATGDVLASTPTPSGLFAEGLTRVEDRLVQLTWKAGKAYVWDLETLNLLQELDYEGQGWGLCYNGTELVMTNGSANLQFRDPTTFELLRTVPVQLGGEAVLSLNELECVNADVYINVWMTDQIIRVDQATGQVNAVIDATDLAQPRPAGSNVLNGIAYDSASGTFYVTGKLWPTMHRVRFEPASSTN